VHLVGFNIGIYYGARTCELQIYEIIYLPNCVRKIDHGREHGKLYIVFFYANVAYSVLLTIGLVQELFR
jgi:hypothetical protein